MSREEKLEKLKELKPEQRDYSDRGTSELFAEMFKDEIVYNTTAKEWFFYNGRFWEVDSGAMYISTLAKEFYDLLMIHSATIENNAERGIYFNFYKRYGSKTKRDILIKDAASNHYISASEFDNKIELFNCLNGTLNLKTFEFRKHRSEDYITKIANVIYNPNAKSDIWEKFLSEIFCDDIEKIHYLQDISPPLSRTSILKIGLLAVTTLAVYLTGAWRDSETTEQKDLKNLNLSLRVQIIIIKNLISLQNS